MLEATQIKIITVFSIVDLIKDVKFENKHNSFQNTLNRDAQTIRNEKKVFVAGDKSTNYHKMAPQMYNDLLEKAIHKEYKKAPPDTVKKIHTSHVKIVSDLDLQDRVFQTSRRQPFVTVKDHKPNFVNNTTCRLINPAKPEIGRISQKITASINTTVRNKTGFNQWQKTGAVINWFKQIKNKRKHKFIQFDVVNFYPSISANLLETAIEWARQFTPISDEQKHIIMESKKSLILPQGSPWMKKGNSEFDIGQGSYDGAESCELVGLYILSKLVKLGINVGLYRDDGLAATNATPRQVEIIKKKIQAIFNELGLGVTIDANLKVVNFLDICMDLSNETYKPFIKPNTTPLYIHSQSNHPPMVIKNLPGGINKRLSSISCNKDVFDSAAPLYQEALEKSGHKFKLEFDPEATKPSTKSRNRKRRITWFNPPFNLSTATNVGSKFLTLIDTCFPPRHPLRKICNRNTLKLSYKCTPNMGSIISARNAKLLNPPPAETRPCNCKAGAVCPLEGKCLTKNLIYKNTVTENSGRTNTYIGLSSNTFKARLSTHKNSLKNSEKNQTGLSRHIHKLKAKNIEYTLKWELVEIAKPFNPISGECENVSLYLPKKINITNAFVSGAKCIGFKLQRW